jgi:outer membrane beta-barrel protein
MKALVTVLLVVGVQGLALAQSEESEAGDVSEVDKDLLGPLRERIRPVSGHGFLKKGRFELSPGITLSVKDAFFTKYLLGASLTSHPVENAAIGLRAGYDVPHMMGAGQISGAAQICEGNPKICTLPTNAQLDRRALGQVMLVAGLDGQWAPIYGKLSLVAESFLSFDMYGLIGANAIQYVGTAGPTFTFGGNVGLGMRFFFNRWLTFRTELRDLVYVEEYRPAGLLRNQILVEFGLSLFFPTTFDQEV